jgi:hypothetical protein
MICGNSGLLVSELVVSKSREILMFFNLVSGACCHRVRANYIVKNNAYDQNSGRFGYYTIRGGTVNGKAHYLADDGNDGIWFDDTGDNWIVGRKSDIGSNRGYFYTSSTASCPYTPGYVWKYQDQYDNFRDADKGFSIWCKS